jgi:hypothetical protein
MRKELGLITFDIDDTKVEAIKQKGEDLKNKSLIVTQNGIIATANAISSMASWTRRLAEKMNQNKKPVVYQLPEHIQN